MNRLARFVAVGVATLSMAACAGANSDSEGNPAENKHSIAFIPGVKGDAFFETAVCGAEAAADELGVDLEVQLPTQPSAQAQVPIIDAVRTRGTDGLIVFPNDPVGVTSSLQQAKDEGIEVFTFSADTEDTSVRSVNITMDLSIGGEVAARELAALVDEDGQVFVMNVQPGVTTTDAREEGFRRGLSDFPDMEYLGQQFGQNGPTKSAELTAAMLKANPELAGVYATNVFSGQGVISALRESDPEKQVRAILHDTAEQEVDALRAGYVDALIGTNAYQYGYQAVSAMVKSLDGEEPKYDIPPERLITAEDLDDETVAKEYIYGTSCNP